MPSNHQLTRSLAGAKASFILLCEQYEAFGKMSTAHSHAMIIEDVCGDTRKTFCSVIQQFQEIGEQLKVLGRNLDEMGGHCVLSRQETEGGRDARQAQGNGSIDERPDASDAVVDSVGVDCGHVEERDVRDEASQEHKPADDAEAAIPTRGPGPLQVLRKQTH